LSTRALKLDGGGIGGGPPDSERGSDPNAAPAIVAAMATENALSQRMRVVISVPFVGWTDGRKQR
jgi:hypothetical protein